MKNKEIKILLIDDEPDILEILGYNLRNEGYQVFVASDGKEGLEKVKEIIPDLVISDIMMPKIDGVELCELIRKKDSLKQIMVIFLTARGEAYSQVAGFEAGADDYITKPIKPKIFISKVKSLLRRLKYENTSENRKRENINVAEPTNNNILSINDLTIDKDAYKVFKGEKEMTLPKKQFELLCLLTSRPDKVFKRDEIMSLVWGNETIVGGRTIDVHMRKLREKIGENHFLTVKGVGYKYIP